MLETLITIGNFQIQTLSVFQILAFGAAGMTLWRRAKEENFQEHQVFDGYLLSFMFGWLMARLAFVIFSLDRLGGDPLKWLNAVQYPGLMLFFGVVGATCYFYGFARKQKWDAFEVLDWWAQAIAIGLIWVNFGYFFAGTRFGESTNLPWGIIFPGVFEKRHPTQLYSVLFYLVVVKGLHWLEYHYRSIEWYRSGKKTAQSGFLFITLMLSYAVFSLIISLIQPPIFMIRQLALDTPIYLLLLTAGVILLLNRSNRSFFSLSDRKFFAVKK